MRAMIEKGATFLVLLLVLICTPLVAFAENLQLAGNFRWLVIASRFTADEAVGVAFYYRLDDLKVVRTRNGRFAIIKGPQTISDPIAEKQKLLSSKVFPSDSYFSRGDQFLETIWSSTKSPSIATKAIAAQEDGFLVFKDLRIDVNWIGSANARSRLAVGRQNGREIFRTSLSAADANYGTVNIDFVRLSTTTGTPSVALSYFTGGAHCCTVTEIFTPDGAGQWQKTEAGELDGGGYTFIYWPDGYFGPAG